MTRRRVAVTGLGVVAPCGIGLDAFWDGLAQTPEPERIRSVTGFDPTDWFDNPKQARRADRFTQLALAATTMALEDAGPVDADPDRSGVMVGTGIGGLNTLETQVEVRMAKGPERVSPFLVPMIMANAAAAEVSMRFGWRGPCETTTTACAAGTHSIGNAARAIGDGRCDAMIAGSAESAMTVTSIGGFTNMTAMTASGISRPFDLERDGFAMAEGSGILILEELEVARARGARVYAEVLGSASTADAHHITAPSPGGSGAVSCMELALADAGVGAGDIAHVNAHGTSTPLNDAAEAEAVAKLFGTPGPALTSIKGVTGHSLGAAGSLEAVASVLSIDRGLIPPTVGYETPDPEMAPLDIVTGEPRAWDPGPVISNSFGFGGHNGSVVIAPVTD